MTDERRPCVPVISSDDRLATVINVFTVAPADQQRLLDLLTRATEFAAMLALSLFGVDVVSITIPGAEQAGRLQRWANATAWATMAAGMMINLFQDTARVRRLRDAQSAGPPAPRPPGANRTVASSG
jgi:TRAP-type C4-dicarboxylate transport system permease small subunit